MLDRMMPSVLELFRSMIALIAISTGLLAQSPMENEEWNFRFDLFQLLLQQENLEPTTSIDLTKAEPGQSVLVLIGDLRHDTNTSRSELLEFVRNGGSLLLAPNRQYESVQFGSVQPGPARSKDRDIQFSNYDDCLNISSFSPHPLTADLSLVVANRSGWIKDLGILGNWTKLMYLPDICYPTQAAGRPIAAVSRIGSERSKVKGGVVLLADPSILSNGMIWFGDNGEFAHRLAKHLQEPHRTQFAMFVDGKPAQKIRLKSRKNQEESSSDESNVEPQRPKLETLLEVANAAIKEVSSPDKLNEQLRDQPRQFHRARYAWTLWLALALGAIGWIFYLLLQRTNHLARYFRSQAIVSGQALLQQAFPLDVSNRIASELLAREFSRVWSGCRTVPEWRQCLEELKHSKRDQLSAQDQAAVESILAIAVFGGRNGMSDQELQDLGQRMGSLIARYRSQQRLPSEPQSYPSFS